MKSRTAIMLAAAAGNAAITSAARESMTVVEGGTSFHIDRYDDGRSKPYRVVFTNPVDGVDSTFRFNTAGFVTNITPDGEPERYVVQYESNGDLDEVISRSSGRRSLLSENDRDEEAGSKGGHTFRRLYDCVDCIDAWDNVCDEGVPSVCELVGYGSPITAVGEAAISTVCDTLGAACSASGGEEACAGQCEDVGGGDDDSGKVLNACFDVTSDSYVCQPTDDLPNTLNLTPCAFNNEDAADLPACFESFGKESLENLWLSFHDELTTLPVGIFEGLDNVVDMDLSYNGLQTLPIGAFSGLSGLLKLEIHWSSLEALPEDLFADVPKLEILRITSSKLTSLPAGIFTPLPYLYELHLSTDGGRFPDVNLQCLPESTAGNVEVFFVDDISDGICECEPAEAITCDAGTSCQPGAAGYTCE